MMKYNFDGTLRSIKYRIDGVLHRDDGPAKICYSGGEITVEYYYSHGVLHCEDGPSIIHYKSGFPWSFQYFFNGKRHRLGGPAVAMSHVFVENIWHDAYSEYWYEGILHRVDGPCIVGKYETGDIKLQAYYICGDLHRLDGPAAADYNRSGACVNSAYYLHGRRITRRELEKFLCDFAAALRILPQPIAEEILAFFFMIVNIKMSFVYDSIDAANISSLSITTRAPVDFATTAPVDIGTLGVGSIIDGVPIFSGVRILIKNQVAPAENGIYSVTVGPAERTEDYAVGDAVSGTIVFVYNGTTLIDTGWICTSQSGFDTVGSFPLNYQQIFGNGVDGNVSTTAVQTLTNKTLTSPIISTISNGGTLTLPPGPAVIISETSTNTLTNKTLGATCTWNGGAIPVANGGTGQTSFSNGILTALSGDFAVIAQPSSALVGISDTQTLSNKTLNNSTSTFGSGSSQTMRVAFVGGAQDITLSFGVSGSNVFTFPAAADTLVGRISTDSLANKTLVFPVISTISNGGTITLPTGARTLVARDTTDTLTNKTITGTTNTVEAFSLRTNTSSVAITAPAPLAGQVLTATSGTAATWQTPTGSAIYGGNFAFVGPISFSTTSATAVLVTGSTLSATLPAGTFCIEWTYKWRYNATNTNFIGRFRVDSVEITVIQHVDEPSDSATTQRRVGYARSFQTLSAGVHSADMQIQGSAAVTAQVEGLTVSWYRVA